MAASETLRDARLPSCITRRARRALKFLVLVPAVAFGTGIASLPVAAADDARLVVDELCSLCHTPQTRPLERMHLTRAQWADAVDRMKGYGVEIPQKKLAAVLDYLAATHGPERTQRQKK